MPDQPAIVHYVEDDQAAASLSAEERMRATLLASKAIPRRRNLIAAVGSVAMEPTSSGAAGFAVWKVVGWMALLAAIASGLAALVAMCMMTPRSPKEWAVGLTSTVVSSLGGGAYAILRLGLHQNLPTDPVALYLTLVAGLGIVFACGLPGWALVRWLFNWIEKNKALDIVEVAAQVRRGAQP